MDSFWPVGLRLALALLLVPILAGSMAAVDPAVAGWARHVVPLPVDPEPPSLGEFADLLAHNALLAFGPLAAAAVLSAVRARSRSIAGVSALLDVLFLSSLVINGAVLAIATASYGPLRLIGWLPHLPLELGALSLSLAVYRAARRRIVTVAQLLAVAAPVLVLITAAAVIETCSQPRV